MDNYKNIFSLTNIEKSFLKNSFLHKLSLPLQYDIEPYLDYDEYYYSEDEEEINEEKDLPFYLQNLKSSDILVCIDIQKNNLNSLSGINIKNLGIFMSSYSRVLYVLDDIMSEKAIIPSDLALYFRNSSNFNIYNKEYGSFLRISNDLGMEEESVSFFHDVSFGMGNDELLMRHEDYIHAIKEEYGRDTLNEMIDELREGHQELITGLDDSFFKKCGSHVDICGGGRNECLAEVITALKIHGITYNIVEPFVYD